MRPAICEADGIEDVAQVRDGNFFDVKLVANERNGCCQGGSQCGFQEVEPQLRHSFSDATASNIPRLPDQWHVQDPNHHGAHTLSVTAIGGVCNGRLGW